MSAEEQNTTTSVTLLLEDKRFEVDKNKLIEKTQYFESLFSHNFSDSKNNEHVVNYNIEPEVLQDFCNWIKDDTLSDKEFKTIKSSLQKFVTGTYDCHKKHLFQLLELSNIYSADQLIDDLTGVIIRFWLKPQIIIELWKLSIDLNLILLKDVTYSCCLTRFMEIPEEELLNMCNDEFLQLICNVNIKSTNNHLLNIINKRLEKCNKTSDSDFLKKKLLVLRKLISSNSLNRKSTIMHCFYTEILETKNDSTNNRHVIYAFQKQDPIKFGELAEVWKAQESTKDKDMAGMIAIGQDYSVYRIGGELRIGSGQFCMDVMRFCLFSKKWYYVASLRKPRRHMAVALVNDKLILIGGVGRYRMKLQCMEILNIYTGEWSDGPKISVNFTDVPPTCVMNGIVVLWVSTIHMFNPTSNAWISVLSNVDLRQYGRITSLTSYQNTLYLTLENGTLVGLKVGWSNDEELHTVKAAMIVSEMIQEKPHVICEKISIDEDGKVFGIAQNFENMVIIKYGLIDSSGQLLSHLYGFREPVISLVPFGNFNLNDPTTLYDQISLT